MPGIKFSFRAFSSVDRTGENHRPLLGSGELKESPTPPGVR
jgi:hypothetical protein